ncbi:hypothetical protein GCM10010465_10320 [Actinomadura fibrosa]
MDFSFILDTLNDSEKYLLYEENGVDCNKPLLQSKKEISKNLVQIQAALEEPQNRQTFVEFNQNRNYIYYRK